MQQRPEEEEEIFSEALSLPPGKVRETFLDKRCGGNANLRRRIENLLLAHQASDGFLDEAAFEPHPLPDVQPREKIGDRLGPYTIIRKLGEGGYGVVYLGEQTVPMRRQVALKIIKMGMDTRAVLARFQAERQMLAMLDHPSIAKILEAGSTLAGAPFYVMELVEGHRITDFCKELQLSTGERLDLVIQVCHAVQHAHQKGIIHRDLKPSNILVTLQDGKPLPKIIDFGIAKMIGKSLGPETLTVQGQMLGTPAYMSPEQLESGGADVDTRTDVYSIGVILYELLTGNVPFEPKKDEGIEGFRRRVQTQEPLKASTSVQLLPEIEKQALAQDRQTSFDALTLALKGDLDAILLKALAHDRSRRYEGVGAFAHDLERFLRNEPVEAQVPGLIYTLEKFIYRHRVLSGAAAMILLILLATAIAVYSASQKEKVALRAAAKASEDLRINLYCADMQQASQAYVEGDFGQTRHLLAQHASSASNRFEWRLFTKLAESDEIWSKEIESLFIAGVDFLNESNILAFSSRAGAIGYLLDAKTGTVLESFGKPGEPIIYSRVSSDRTKVMIARLAGGCELWDLPSRKLIYQGPEKGWRFAFHPQEPVVAILKKLAHPAPSARILIYNFEKKQVVIEFDVSGNAIEFSSDGEKLVTSTVVGKIEVWNWRNGTALSQFDAPHSDIHDIRIIPGKPEVVRIASCCGFDIWNYETQQRVRHLQEDTFAIHQADLNPNGSLLALSSANQSVVLWDTQTWKPIRRLRGHGGGAIRANFSPDGRHLVSGGGDGIVRFWNTATMKDTNQFGALWFPYSCFSPGSKQVVGYRLEGTVEIWSADPIAPIAKLSTKSLPLGFASENVVWLWNAEKEAISISEWHYQTENVLQPATLLRMDTLVDLGAVSPQMGKIAVGSTELLEVWDVALKRKTPLERPKSALPMQLARGEFSRDGKYVAFGISNTEFCVWEVHSGRLVQMIEYPAIPITQVAISPDGLTVAAAGLMHDASLWEIGTGKLLRTFKGHIDRVLGITFSNDGQTLITSSYDMTARFFNVATGRQAGKIRCREYVDRVWLSPDNNLLVTLDRFQPAVWKAVPRARETSSNSQARE